MLLEGQVCIVTGAGSRRGIGRATAGLFARHGATCVVVDVDGEAARRVAAELGEPHLGVACDVRARDQCEAVAVEALHRYGRIDVLVNNAGISSPLAFMDIDAEDYERVMDVNLRGMLYMSQAVVPAMRERHRGAIVNLSSISAQRGGGIFGGPHYSASKGGVLGLSRNMARELGPDGIRVNAVAPSLIDTDIVASKIGDAEKAEIAAGIPLRRVGQVDDVANAILFLASDLAGYVTGITLDVNGGMLIH